MTKTLSLSGKRIQSFHRVWELDPRLVSNVSITVGNHAEEVYKVAYPVSGEWVDRLGHPVWTFLNPEGRRSHNIERLVTHSFMGVMQTVLWYHKYETVFVTVEFKE